MRRLCVLLVCCLAAVAQSGPIPATYFGMNLASNSHATLLPIGNMGKEIAAAWGYIEPNAPVGAGCPGTVNCTHTYNWGTLDSFVTVANANGLPFMWTFDKSPSWAVSGVGCSGSPTVQCTGPITDFPDFDAFMNALVQRYDGAHAHGTISAYETNNENQFTGTMAQFAQYVNHQYVAIRANNPSALISGISIADPDKGIFGDIAPGGYATVGGYFDQFWTAIRAINPTFHLDALTYHGYPHNLAGNPYTGSILSPEVVTGPCAPNTVLAGYVACVKGAITRNGLPANTPVWDSEGSWGDGAATGGFTAQQEAGFVGRFELISWSAGAARQNWYQLENPQWGTLCTGSPCALNTPGIAYREVRNWMVGSTMTTPCAASGTVWTCGLTLAGGQQALAVWNTAGSSTYTPAPGTYSQFRDLSGGTTTLGSTVTIGIQPLLLVGSSAAPLPPTGFTFIIR